MASSSAAFALPYLYTCCLYRAVAGRLGFEALLVELGFLRDLALGILEAVGHLGRSCTCRNHKQTRNILCKDGRMEMGRMAARRDFRFAGQRDSYPVLDMYMS